MTHTRSVHMQGQLEHDGLSDYLQLLAHTNRAARIAATTHAGDAVLYVVAGQIRHARSSADQGESVVRELLHSRGTFVAHLIHDQELPTLPTPNMPAGRTIQNVLMDAALELDHTAMDFLIDEPEPASTHVTPTAGTAANGRAALPDTRPNTPAMDAAREGENQAVPLNLPDPAAIPQLTVPLERLSESFSAQVRRVLGGVDGVRTVQSISDELGLGLHFIQQALGTQADRGHVTFHRPRLPQAFWTEVLQRSKLVVGPAAELLLEDAAADLGITPGHVHTDQAVPLLETLASFIPPAKAQAFAAHASALRSAYQL